MLTESYRPEDQSAVIHVHPAVPLTLPWASLVIHGLLHGIVLDPIVRQGEAVIEPIVTPHGLSGHVSRSVAKRPNGPLEHHDTVALFDERYRYVIRLESQADHAALHRPVFARLVDSLEPVPSPPDRSAIAPMLDFWIE